MTKITTTAPSQLLLLILIIVNSSILCHAFVLKPRFRHINNKPQQHHILIKAYQSDNSDHHNDDGSILGASLLYAGTAIGAGAIALPAETIGAGFLPSTFGLVLCWIFTFVTSMMTLEASWLAASSEKVNVNTAVDNDGGSSGGGFLSISKMSLGVPGEIITALLFWFLLTAIIVAYTAEGGQLVSQFIQEVIAPFKEDENVVISPAIGSFFFASFFATLANFGTASVDAINRIFVTGLIVTFLSLVWECLPLVQVSNLLSHSDWSKLYPPVISIGILSLGAQNVVPTLLQYLKNDPKKTRQAIFIGSLVPLILYLVWEAIFLGVVDISNMDGSNDADAMSALLGQVGGDGDSTVVSDLIEGFSFCAIGSSMAGASVSLVDFFQDGITIFSNSHDDLSKEGGHIPRKDNLRIVATALALGPPVILAYAFPNIFLVALEEAGLLGGVSLYGILPAISIIALKYHFSSDKIAGGQTDIMPGRLGGGEVSRIALVIVSLALVLPEINDLL